jgi:uncharacterized protein YjbJ (UPF0337 family)
MNKQKIKGKVNQIKGQIKERAGYASGDKSTELRGIADQGKGETQSVVGKVKDAFKKGRRKAA